MMLIFSKQPALADTYAEILSQFNPTVTTQKENFLGVFKDAKMVIIDDDFELMNEVLALNLPITILFIGEKCNVEDVSFLPKPLSSSVLLAKVSFLWQRIQRGLQISFQTPHYSFDGNSRTLNDIALTQKEAELIEYLWENKDRCVSKEELLKQIFGYNECVETHTLETHIYKLRQKIGVESSDLILTQGGGYQINLE